MLDRKAPSLQNVVHRCSAGLYSSTESLQAILHHEGTDGEAGTSAVVVALSHALTVSTTKTAIFSFISLLMACLSGFHPLPLFLVIIWRVGVSTRLAGLPTTVMVIGVTGVTPSPITIADRALMQIASIALAERSNISVAAQEVLAWLLTNGESLTSFH